jgi:ubiquinone/menaquinone biosynthesis C-methylase UbiE
VRTPWFPDELAHAGAEHLDAAYVAGYEAKAGWQPDDDVAELLRHGVGPTSTVVDLGAGTGTFAIAIAPLCGRVVALDVSPAMVEAIQAKVVDAKVVNVDVVRAGLLTHDLPDRSTDAVFSRHALHQLPDFWKVVALDRMFALLKPGGIFRLRDLVFSMDPAEVVPRVEAWLNQAASDPQRGWTRPELEAHVRGEFSTFTWLLEPILERVGFTILDAEHSPNGIYAAYTCRRE